MRPSLFVLLRAADATVTVLCNRKLKFRGLTAAEHAALVDIRRAGKHLCTVADLAREFRLDRNSVMQTVRELERRGLVVASKVPGKRGRVWTVTQQGTVLCDDANRAYAEFERKLRRQLGGSSSHALVQALERLLAEVRVDSVPG